MGRPVTLAGTERESSAPELGETRSTSTTVHATWRGERRYEIGRPGGPVVNVDAAGRDGLGPVDTMLGALAACSAIDVVEYLAKRRTPASRLDVRVDAERRPTAPRRVLRARLEFVIDGDGIDVAHAERAIMLSFQTYCSISHTLAPDVRLESRLVLNGEARPAVVQRGADAT